MRPTEILSREHQVILAVCGAAEREALAVRGGRPVEAEKVAAIVDFLRNYADRFHHAKEEDLLFVKMQEKGFPREFGPIGVMLQDHAESRANVQAVADNLAAARAGEAAALTAVADNLLAYTALLRAHIHKEDNILYPMADQAFSAADQESLAAAFAGVTRDSFEAGVAEKYERIAAELAGR